MSKFEEKVVEAVKAIPVGKVASYGQVALMIGLPRCARHVGHALHYHGEGAPWWRVINNAGRISTTCLEHPALMQKHLLKADGVFVAESLKIDIEKYRYRPTPAELKKLELGDEYIRELIERFLI